MNFGCSKQPQQLSRMISVHSTYDARNRNLWGEIICIAYNEDAIVDASFLPHRAWHTLSISPSWRVLRKRCRSCSVATAQQPGSGYMCNVVSDRRTRFTSRIPAAVILPNICRLHFRLIRLWGLMAH